MSFEEDNNTNEKVLSCLTIIEEELDKIAEVVGHVNYQKWLKLQIEEAYEKQSPSFMSDKEANLQMLSKLAGLKKERINTEEENQEALERIEQLWGSEPNTPEGKELDKLIKLVEEFEDWYYPVSILKLIDKSRYNFLYKGEIYTGTYEEISGNFFVGKKETQLSHDLYFEASACKFITTGEPI